MIKAPSGLTQVVVGLQNAGHGLELLLVALTIFLHVGFILPCQSAGMLLMRAHRAAMIGPIVQKFFDDGCVTSHKAAA